MTIATDNPTAPHHRIGSPMQDAQIGKHPPNARLDRNEKAPNAAPSTESEGSSWQ